MVTTTDLVRDDAFNSSNDLPYTGDVRRGKNGNIYVANTRAGSSTPNFIVEISNPSLTNYASSPKQILLSSYRVTGGLSLNRHLVSATYNVPTPVNSIVSNFINRNLNQKQYELKDHLGNVHVVLSDLKKAVDDGTYVGGVKQNNTQDGIVDYYKADVVSATEYYAFGAPMPGRSSPMRGGYRYGFNGKENDEEIVGTGAGTQDYGFRIYNPSLGKFLSVDPLTKKYPHYTPYSFAGNTPIVAIDIDGLEDMWVHFRENDDGSFTKVTEDFDLGDNQRAANASAMGGLDIPSTGVVYTFEHLDGSYSAKKITERVTITPNKNTTENISEFAASSLNKLQRKMTGNSQTSAEGYKGFEGYVGAVDNVGEGIEEVGMMVNKTPFIGRVISKPFQIAGATIGLAADFMNTAADIEQKGFGQGLKNGIIRGSFTVGTNLLNSTVGGTGSQMGENYIKTLFNFTGERVKDGIIEQSNKSYYKSLQPFKLDTDKK